MKIDWDRKYTTLSAYAIIVFLVCFIIFRLTNNLESTISFFSTGIKVLSPILVGLLIAYFVNPLVHFTETKLLPLVKIRGKSISQPKILRRLSLTFSYFVLLTLIAIMLNIIIPQIWVNVAEVLNNSTSYVRTIQIFLNKLSFTYEDTVYNLDLNAVTTYLNTSLLHTLNTIPDMVKNVVPNAINITFNLLSSLIKVVISIIISIYILANKERASSYLKRMVVAFLPKKQSRFVIETMTFANKVYTNFYVGQLIDSTLIGTLLFIILLIVKMPFALLISVLVGLTNFVPYFGPFIGGGISFVLLLLVDPVKAVWFLIIILTLQQIDGNVLAPKILGESIGLAPFWIIFSVLVFGSMFGFVGMLLGAPTFKVIKFLFDSYIDAMFQKKAETENSGPHI